MKREFYERYKKYMGAENLNIGCGFNPEPSKPGEKWTNLDMNPDSPADVIAILGTTLPFDSLLFDCVLASHVLEHLDTDALYRTVYEVARVLKPGGHFIYVVPHGANSKCFANPLHLQRLDESSYLHFMRETYEREDSAGQGAHQGHRFAQWVLAEETLTPEPWLLEIEDPKVRDWHRMHTLNAIEEVQCVLRLVAR